MDTNRFTQSFRRGFASFFCLQATDEQAEVMEHLTRFVVEPVDRKLYVLTGYAGTGKTTLLGAFVKNCVAHRIKVVLMAPTGRAAKVFSNKAERSAMTIHKRIYRKVSVDGGGIQLALAPNSAKNTIFIVDEASMIGDYTLTDKGIVGARNLLEDLIEFVYKGENCSLIFVGDEGQLPPVGSDFSPALSQEYLSHSFSALELYIGRLKKVLRQADDSDILLNATRLRSAQEFFYPRLKLRENQDLRKIEGGELLDALETAYSTFGRDETIFITRSNKRANQYNQHIRNRILWFEEELCSGDLLMVVKNNYFWLDEKSEAGFIANGEIATVKRIMRIEELYGFRFAKVRLQLIDYPDMGDFETIVLLDTLSVEAPALDRDSMKKLFFAIEEEYLDEHNKKKRYEKIMKNPYFNALQIKFAYAITCHKAQGGQWSCVFLDHGYLTDEMLDTSFFRWLYTGFTRASEQLNLVQFYPEFFEEGK
jgi:exodeoxyribonuclease-5